MNRNMINAVKTVRATRRRSISPIGYIIVATGIIISAFSIDYQSSLTAFIGVSLVFWGALLLYIRPSRYLPSSVLNAITGVQMLKNQLAYNREGYIDKPVYQPRTSLEDLSDVRLILRKEEGTEDKNKVIEATPIGLGLHSLAEKEMKVNFSSTNFKDLKNSLERCFVETLEVADSVKFTEEGRTIMTEITGNIFQESLEKSYVHEVNRPMGDPLTSAIACILARAMNSQVIIDKIDLQKNNKKISVNYQILENRDGEMSL